jgi:hypothetical protein
MPARRRLALLAPTLLAAASYAGCAAQQAPITPPVAPFSKPSLPPAPELPGCPDGLRLNPASDGWLEGGVRARFVFEAVVDDLDKVPPSALPPGFDRTDPHAYRPGEDPSTLPSRLIPRELAIQLGAADTDAPIAVYNESGGPACMAQPGEHYALLHYEHWYAPYLEIQRKLEGCAPREGEPRVTILARSMSPLDHCVYQSANEIAFERFHFSEGPVEAPPQSERIGALPADMAVFSPPGPCAPPACLRAFTLRGVELPVGPSFYSLSISHLRPVYGDDECAIYAGNTCAYAFTAVMRAEPGAAAKRWAEAQVEGALADARGARYVVTSFHEPRGGIAVHRVEPSGPPRQLQRFETYYPYPEDSAFERYSDCPYCGP